MVIVYRNRVGAVVNGLHEGVSFLVNNYLISGFIHNVYKGYQSHLQEEIEPRHVAADLIDEFEYIITNEFGIEVAPLPEDERLEAIDEIVEEVELLKCNVYPIISKYLFDDLERYQRLTYLCMAFCREQSRIAIEDGQEYGDERADFRQEIRDIVSEFQFSDPGDEEYWFLQTYSDLRESIQDGGKAGKSEGDIESQTTDSNDCEMLYWNFVYTYIPLQHPEYNEKSKTEQERLRSKVIQLIHDAELNSGSASQNILKIIQQEEERIREKYEQRQAYMVFSQSISGSNTRDDFTDKLEKKFPYHVDIGNKSYHTPEDGENPIFLTQHIVYPASKYSDLEDFYEQGISKIVPEGHFVAVMEITTSEYYLPKDSETLQAKADTPAHIEGSISSLEFLQTEHPPEDITSRAIDNLLGDEIEVKEMLKSLRVDVLIPGISTAEQTVIRQNREEIETKFEIQDIFDWRKKDPEDIAEYIYKQDSYTDNSEDDWCENTRILTERAENWYRATQTIK